MKTRLGYSNKVRTRNARDNAQDKMSFKILVKVAMSCKILVKGAKSCKILVKGAKSFKILVKGAMSFKILVSAMSFKTGPQEQ
jgi:hypothetical protein